MANVVHSSNIKNPHGSHNNVFGIICHINVFYIQNLIVHTHSPCNVSVFFCLFFAEKVCKWTRNVSPFNVSCHQLPSRFANAFICSVDQMQLHWHWQSEWHPFTSRHYIVIYPLEMFTRWNIQGGITELHWYIKCQE